MAIIFYFYSFPGDVTHLKVSSGFLIYVVVSREAKIIRRINMLNKTDEKDGMDILLQTCIPISHI